MKKKVLSFVLVLCLLVGYLPLSAGALTPYYSHTSAYKASKYYTQLCNVNLTGNGATDIVAVARSQSGYHEGNSAADYGGGSTGTGNYTEYNRNFYGRDQAAAWCANFVMWCARSANISTSVIPNSSSYSSINHELWGAVGTKLASTAAVTKGDLILLSGHIGIATENAAAGSSTVKYISGNATGDAVKESNLGRSNIWFIVRPNYKNCSHTYGKDGVCTKCHNVDVSKATITNRSTSAAGNYVCSDEVVSKKWDLVIRSTPYNSDYNKAASIPYSSVKNVHVAASVKNDVSNTWYEVDSYTTSSGTVTGKYYVYQPRLKKSSHTTHTKGAFQFYEAAHPHYNYYKCSVCGQNFTDGSTTKLSSCNICYPDKHTTLRRGSTGSEVKTLQTMLNKVNNAGLTVDGDFGSGTETAVKNYQGKKGLTVDGVCGANTWAALEADYNQDPTPGKPTLTGVSSTYTAPAKVTFKWASTQNTTHYNLRIQEKKNGSWADKERVEYASSGLSKTFNAGEYRAFVQSTNGNASGWPWKNSDYVYFSVTNPVIIPTSVSLNKTSLTLTVGKSETLTATVAPSNASDKSVSWSSSSTVVATVSNGKVTAVQAGTATITVKTNSGGKTATCQVTVQDAAPTSPWIKADKTSVAVGENITFTYGATGASSYSLGIDKDGVRVSTPQLDAATYTTSFNTPGNYEIYATCKNSTGYADSSKISFTVNEDEDEDEDTPLDPTPENSFIDVPNGAYFAEAVNWAVDKGITAGTSSNTFSPNAICTRAQAVTFLWRAAGSPEPSGGSTKFVDVASGQYYTKAVQWAVEKGITGGTSATTFSPNDKCTRAQIVTFQYRMHNSPSVSGVSPFADVPPTLYYANAVAWAVENGITSGTSASTFSPHNDCSRGQIVTFLYRDMN